MGRKPKRLRASIGGYMGPSYAVRLMRGKLEYKSCEQGYANWKTETIPVTDEQWAAFHAAMNSLGVWRWKKEYPNPGVCDGTQWDVDIAYADKAIQSHGDNNYPGSDTSESRVIENSRVFRRFTKAIRSLVGGREFQ